MQSLPKAKRPIKGTIGEEYRQCEFAKQMPKHDLAPQDSAMHSDSASVKKEIETYLAKRRRDLGQGELRNANDFAKHGRMPASCYFLSALILGSALLF